MTASSVFLPWLQDDRSHREGGVEGVVEDVMGGGCGGVCDGWSGRGQVGRGSSIIRQGDSSCLTHISSYDP